MAQRGIPETETAGTVYSRILVHAIFGKPRCCYDTDKDDIASVVVETWSWTVSRGYLSGIFECGLGLLWQRYSPETGSASKTVTATYGSKASWGLLDDASGTISWLLSHSTSFIRIYPTFCILFTDTTITAAHNEDLQPYHPCNTQYIQLNASRFKSCYVDPMCIKGLPTAPHYLSRRSVFPVFFFNTWLELLIYVCRSGLFSTLTVNELQS